jgi:hypothetical protein
MKRRRSVAAALGVVVLFASVTVVGSALGAPVGTILLATLGNDYLVAAAVASLGLLLAVPVLLSARASTLDQATMPTPERGLAMQTPGAAFDEVLDSRIVLVPYVPADRREAVRTELRTTAVDVVAHTSSASRPEAAARVATGSWTDDETAAAFLDDEAPNSSSIRALGARLGTALWSGDSPFQRSARRTSMIILERAEAERRSR